ncbi:hypothetical protein [Paenibacillus gallinarum]|uniref:Uncharacterized protein n=1 Tax=Paenibacillus gallinarum TaxID=2762232 RepID=A0ABR8SXW0_9BACL|nr:hypothetical protein [Paenibacillus gallinarum]MBD7968347.1 hypothetical protein [Paenibacillus gallinarum]
MKYKELIHSSKKRKTTFIGLGLLFILLILWAGNIGYYNRMQLKKPVFPTHYLTTTIFNGTNLMEIDFMENKGPGKKVQSILIEEFNKESYSKNERGRYKYQLSYQMHFKFTEKDLEYLPDQSNELIVNTITVNYDDGTSEQVPIGELIFRANPEKSQDLALIHGGSSSDGSGYEVFEMNSDAVLEKIELSHTDKLKDLFQLRVYGKPYDQVTYPKQIKKGDSIHFQYASIEPRLAKDGFISYSVGILVHFRLPDGSKIVYDLLTSNHFYYSSDEIKKIVRDGGAVK